MEGFPSARAQCWYRGSHRAACGVDQGPGTLPDDPGRILPWHGGEGEGRRAKPRPHALGDAAGRRAGATSEDRPHGRIAPVASTAMGLTSCSCLVMRTEAAPTRSNVEATPPTPPARMLPPGHTHGRPSSERATRCQWLGQRRKVQLRCRRERLPKRRERGCPQTGLLDATCPSSFLPLPC
jgi:hypothetical protein